VTSGLIDPGRSNWGTRPVTFARRRLLAPRVDLDRLDPAMQQWARRRLVPKVLVANQTAIVEAVCDPRGEWLPGVPVIAVYPTGAHWDDRPATDRAALTAATWEIAAVLTAPYASAWIRHRSAGTGLAAGTVRLSPTVLADLPWPTGRLDAAVASLQRGDLRSCAELVDDAYGVAPAAGLGAWWSAHLDRIERRH
jgi:hypothetical protein